MHVYHLRSKNRKDIAVAVLIMVSPLLYADTVYLDTGKALQGIIVSNTSNTVIIKTESGKEDINRNFIKRISYSANQVRPVTADVEK
jgi:hypothetical protein